MEKLKYKRIGYLSILIFLFYSCEFSAPTIEVISSDDMELLLLSDTVQLIDVRSFEDFQQKHINNAQSIVYDDDFEKNIQRLDKSKPVAVYCRTGRRSKLCSQILKKQGFTKIYELKGGLEQWKHEEWIVEKDSIQNQ